MFTTDHANICWPVRGVQCGVSRPPTTTGGTEQSLAAQHSTTWSLKYLPTTGPPPHHALLTVVAAALVFHSITSHRNIPLPIWTLQPPAYQCAARAYKIWLWNSKNVVRLEKRKTSNIQLLLCDAHSSSPLFMAFGCGAACYQPRRAAVNGKEQRACREPIS